VSLFLYELHKNVVRAARDLKVATVVHALFMIRNHFLSCNTGCQSPCVSVWDYAYIYYIFVRVCMCMSVLCMWQALNTLRNTLDRSVHWYSLSAPYNVYGMKSSRYLCIAFSLCQSVTVMYDFWFSIFFWFFFLTNVSKYIFA